MPEEITLEEAIRTAIEYETKVRDVYKEAEQQIDDAKGKHVMGALVSEEQGHLDYLNLRLSEWEKTGSLNIEDLATHIPSREMISEKTQILKEKVKEVLFVVMINGNWMLKIPQNVR